MEIGKGWIRIEKTFSSSFYINRLKNKDQVYSAFELLCGACICQELFILHGMDWIGFSMGSLERKQRKMGVNCFPQQRQEGFCACQQILTSHTFVIFNEMKSPNKKSIR